MNKYFEQLRPYLERNHAYQTALALLSWDAETLAPTESPEYTSKSIGILSEEAYHILVCDEVKALIKKTFDEAFAKYDVILGPVAPTTAPRIGESLSDPMKMYLSDIYTISVNLAGLPGMSVPCGVDAKGLPIGLQLIGNCFEEKKLIQAAFAYEKARGAFGRKEEA